MEDILLMIYSLYLYFAQFSFRHSLTLCLLRLLLLMQFYIPMK